MTKKVLALSLVSAMFLSLLASCSQNETTSTVENSAVSTTSSGSSSVSSGDTPQLEKEGKTITIYTSTIIGEDAKPDNAMVKEYIEEQLGYAINPIYVLRDNYGEKMNVVFVSGEKYDAFTADGLGGRTWNTMADDGLILPLNDLVEQYGPNITKYVSEGFAFSTNQKTGNFYALPKRVSNHNGSTPTIRKDWVKKAGLSELPTTIEEYEQYMDYVLKNDVNENGDPTDEIPLMPLGQGSLVDFYAGIFMGEDGIGKNYLSEDGKVMPRASHPLYLPYLTKLREWYEKEYIYKEFFVIKQPQIEDMITADRIGGTNIWYSRVVRPFESVAAADPSKEYSLLPTFDAHVEGITPTWNAGTEYGNNVYIPAVSENPELVIDFFDWTLREPENNVTVTAGLEGTHWEWTDKENFLYELKPGASDRYAKGFQFAHQWDAVDQLITEAPTNYISQTYARFLEEMNDPAKTYTEQFDLRVPYTTIGTDLEFLNNDAPTLLNENELKYIIGEISEEEMQQAIHEYMELYGNTAVEVYTSQYEEFLGN